MITIKKIIGIIAMTLLLVSSLTINVFAADEGVGVSYKTHIQNIGWQSFVSNGAEAGTHGKSLRMEALKIKLNNVPKEAGIKYETHVQNIGWQKPVYNGQESGTHGKSLRLEAIKISLINLPGYSVQYRVHVQNVGWQKWVKDGALSGTTGKSLRLEAIEVKIVPNEATAIHTTSVNLNKTEVNLKTGQTDKLTAKLLPENATNKSVNWKSSNESVVKVDSSGKVIAVGVGNASITAATVDGNKTSTCNVTVTPVGVTGINLNKTTDNLKIGQTDNLVAKVLPENATNKNVKWSTSNESVVTVDESGKVKAVSEGKAEITVVTVDGSKTAICKVTVTKPVKVNGITLDKTEGTLKVGESYALKANVLPKNADNKDVKWTSSNNYIAKVDNLGKVTAVSAGSAVIKAETLDGNKIAAYKVTVNNPALDGISVSYQGKVEKIGWQNIVSDGQEAGTVGKSLKLEAIKINLLNAPKGARIKYEAHVQNVGWQSWVKDGQIAGTEGKNLRIEAIKISLENMPGYSVEYKVHVQNVGWQSWVKNGQVAGTQGKGLRLETIKIKIVKDMNVQYATHVQNVGWQAPVSNGEISGTSGRNLRIEALNIKLLNALNGASIKYQTHVQNIGWQNWTKEGENAGTTGKSLRIEALKIQLVNAPGYSVQYQVDVENLGWQPWVQDGQQAGTMGRGLRIQGIRMKVISNPNGVKLPGIKNPPESVKNTTSYKVASYLQSDSNVDSVGHAAVALHGGDQSNNCVYFSSEALRRVGVNVPLSMANTKRYVPYLKSTGWKQNFNIGSIAPGNIAFTTNDVTGNPSHTFVFLDWVNPDDHTEAYVADNQSSGVHVRSMVATFLTDAFAFFFKR